MSWEGRDGREKQSYSKRRVKKKISQVPELWWPNNW